MKLAVDRLLRPWRTIWDSVLGGVPPDALVLPRQMALSSHDWLAPHLAAPYALAPFAADFALIAARPATGPTLWPHPSTHQRPR